MKPRAKLTVSNAGRRLDRRLRRRRAALKEKQAEAVNRATWERNNPVLNAAFAYADALTDAGLLLEGGERERLLTEANRVVTFFRPGSVAPMTANADVEPAPLIVNDGPYTFDLRHLHANPEARRLYHDANRILKRESPKAEPDGPFEQRAANATQRLLDSLRQYVNDIDSIRESIQR